MTPAIALPPPLPSAQPKRGDFADWLSPILVKELRQGLQSKLFLSAFVLLQAAMILLVGFGLLSAENKSVLSNFFEGCFQVCVWVPLMIFMPSRGLRAIGEETRAQTLDLVQLTRMSSFRIVWGKWVALVAQSFLLASSILPYAVLRYYFGRVDVTGELINFGLLLLGSMVLTAAAVSLSAAHAAMRILALVLLVFFLMGLSGMTMAMRFAGVSGPTFRGVVEATLWILPGVALYIFFFLEFAASKIAPLAENHAARKRGLCLLLAILVLGAGWLGSRDAFQRMATICLPIMAFSVIEALCEYPVNLPALFRSFAKRGVLGRLAGRMLYPGWPSGVIFTALIVALTWLGFAGYDKNHWASLHPYSSISGSPSLSDRVTFDALGPMIFLALVSPLPLLQLFPRLKKRLWPYILVQGLQILVFTVSASVADIYSGARRAAVFAFTAPFPSAALITMVSEGSHEEVLKWLYGITPATGIVLMVWLGFLLFRQFAMIRRMEELSLGEPPQAGN